MATRSSEIPQLYGHGARKIDREKAGYRPRPTPETEQKPKEPGFVYQFIQQIMNKLINDLEPQFSARQHQGDQESYEINEWL